MRPLPLAASEPTSAHDATTPAAAVLVPSAPRATILLAEDDATSCMALQELLVGAGYRVLSADSAATALAVHDREGPADLVIADVILPDARGDAMVKRIRESGCAPAVIYMSGREAPPEEGVRFVPKPIELPTLLTLIDDALAGRG
jgi:CheY-like chemotaxis protein